MNIEGLTNRQVLVRALRRLVTEVETGLVSAEAIEWAKTALGEVVRNKKPESLPKLKPTKKVQF
jgi:hypothetical protein